MDKQKKWAGWIIAALVVIVAAVALAMSGKPQETTEAEDSVLQEALPTLKELFPDADENGFERLELAEENDGLQFAYKATGDGKTLGHALKTTVEGYGGPIEIIIGIGTDRTLRGIRVGGNEFNETEDLGAKAKDPEFTDQFQGKTVPLALGENIDAISGATVTSRAVTEGVNAAVMRLDALLGSGGTSASMPQAASEGRTANASAIGYGGPVLVRLTLDQAGAITALDIGGERFMETEDVGGRVRDEAFTQQFIGQTPPLALGEGIDAVSGATISSQAVVDAVNEAADFLK